VLAPGLAVPCSGSAAGAGTALRRHPQAERTETLDLGVRPMAARVAIVSLIEVIELLVDGSWFGLLVLAIALAFLWTTWRETKRRRSGG
jgi:hypothetical protein